MTSLVTRGKVSFPRAEMGVHAHRERAKQSVILKFGQWLDSVSILSSVLLVMGQLTVQWPVSCAQSGQLLEADHDS